MTPNQPIALPYALLVLALLAPAALAESADSNVMTSSMDHGAMTGDNMDHGSTSKDGKGLPGAALGAIVAILAAAAVTTRRRL